jgi:hypothetical protein
VCAVDGQSIRIVVRVPVHTLLFVLTLTKNVAQAVLSQQQGRDYHCTSTSSISIVIVVFFVAAAVVQCLQCVLQVPVD